MNILTKTQLLENILSKDFERVKAPITHPIFLEMNENNYLEYIKYWDAKLWIRWLDYVRRN